MLVDNEAGRAGAGDGLFRARGLPNIDSLTVSETDHENICSRITIRDRRHAA